MERFLVPNAQAAAAANQRAAVTNAAAREGCGAPARERAASASEPPPAARRQSPVALQQTLVEDFFEEAQASPVDARDDASLSILCGVDGATAVVSSGGPSTPEPSASRSPSLLRNLWSRYIVSHSRYDIHRQVWPRDLGRWLLSAALRLQGLPITFEASREHPTTGPNAHIQHIEFDRLGALMLTATENGVIRLYDYDEVRNAKTLLRNAAASHSTTRLVTEPSIEPIHAFSTSSRVRHVVWMPAREDVVMVCSQSSQDVAIYDLARLPSKPTSLLSRESTAATSRGHPSDLGGSTFACFLGNPPACAGSTVVTGDAAGCARLWDLRSKRPLVWTANGMDGIKASRALLLHALSGHKRSRDSEGPATGAEGHYHITESTRVWSPEHASVRHILQVNGDQEVHAVLAGGAVVGWDLRKMVRQAFGTAPVPNLTQCWDVFAALQASPHYNPTSYASGTGYPLVKSVLATMVPEAAPFFTMSDGCCFRFDTTTGSVCWAAWPEEPLCHPPSTAVCRSVITSADLLPLASGPVLTVAEKRIVAQFPSVRRKNEPTYFRGPAGDLSADPVVLFDGSVLNFVDGGSRAHRYQDNIHLDVEATCCRVVPTRSDEIVVGSPGGEVTVFGDLRLT